MQFIPLNFITSLFGGSYTKTPRTNQYSQVLTGAPQFLSPDTWDAHEIYMTTPQLYAVIQRRGYLLSSGLWKHYKTVGGKPILIENSPIVKILENPNPLMHGNDHIRQWNENKCVYGNNYEYLQRGLPTLPVVGMTNLPAAQMQIHVSGKWYAQRRIEDIILGYELQDSAGMTPFTTDEINHTRYISGKNPVKGESPMSSLHMPLSNIRGAYGFRNTIINRKGALGILSNDAKDSSGAIPLTEKERTRLNDEYQRLYGINDGQMQTIMTNSSLKWQAMTFPTKDLMLFEEVSEDFLAIIDAYGLNANIFSRTTGSTFENLSEGIKQAYQSTIIPEAEELAMNRTQVFNLIERGEWLELDYSHIAVLQENQKEKSEVLEKKANAVSTLATLGLYTPDQLRSVFGLKQ